MSEFVIQAESLGKAYVIAHKASEPERYTALRDILAQGFRNAAVTARNALQGRSTKYSTSSEDYWALQDVSFNIRQGDRVGIIGRNGAGKSTLLKILSRITEPTRGRVQINGRVASLLEVGTGFHPELTGRENIFLNGAILGMSRQEVSRKFDAIVDFAEVEKFLDTPVKRYSSGMYVRLAFAVAAHLEPEILIVDEVLAVGDIAFQKKCMSHMSTVGSAGGTVLFVSHNIGAIEQLCNSVIRLHQGRMEQHSYDVAGAIRSYMGGMGSNALTNWHNAGIEHDNDWFLPTRFHLNNDQGKLPASTTLGVNDQPSVFIEGICKSSDPALQIGIAVYGESGELIFWSFTTDDQSSWPKLTLGKNVLEVRLPSYLLNEGSYRIELGIALYRRAWICEPGKSSPAIRLELTGGFSASSYWTEKRVGLLAPKLSWKKCE